VGRSGNTVINLNHFTLVGYTIGTFPSNLAPRGSCLGSPNTNVDGQLAKNWFIKERLRVKFSMDFFNLFNHANFNSNNLEGAGYSPGNLYCGGATAPVVDPVTGNSANTGQPCSPTNNVVTTSSLPAGGAGFGTANSVHAGRQLQYTLRFSF
jgi:hypothetical protein